MPHRANILQDVESYAVLPSDPSVNQVCYRSAVAVGGAAGALGTAAVLVAVNLFGGGPTRVQQVLDAQSAFSAKYRDPPAGPGAPASKNIVVGMDTNVNYHIAWDDWEAWSARMKPYWTEDMIYDFNYVGEWGFGATKGLRAWFDGEHMHFNYAIPDCQWTDFIRAAQGNYVTSASYGLAYWNKPFAGVPPPSSRTPVHIHDLDFYLIEGNRIKINWCIIDVVDLFEQAGYRLLPPAPMKHDWGYIAPKAMDGFPAPLSLMVTAEDSEQSLRVWNAALEQDYGTKSGWAGSDTSTGELGQSWAIDATWYGPGGVGTATSRAEYVKHFLEPLHSAFADVTRTTDAVLCEGSYCGAHFYLHGTHVGKWLGEEATGKRVPIRCGAHARVEGGRIVEGWLIIDHARAFHAMGIDLYGRYKVVAAAYSSASTVSRTIR